MAEAVIVGALAPGVNRPTWTAFRNVMISLSVVLAVQLAIAVQWSSNELLLHVCCLTALAATLFLLLKWFVSETGLVTVQQQMDELGALNNKAQHCSWQHKSKQLGLQVRAVSSEEEEFEARLARIQRKSAAGKKAAARKAKKLEGSGGASKGGKALLLPPVPLEDAISEGLVVELGFNPYTERLNGRFAMLGLAALLLVELATGSSFVKYHEAAIIGIQAYTMLAIAALFVKYEKEKRSVWPPQA